MFRQTYSSAIITGLGSFVPVSQYQLLQIKGSEYVGENIKIMSRNEILEYYVVQFRAISSSTN